MASGPEVTLSEVLKPVPEYYKEAEVPDAEAQFKDFDNPHNFRAFEKSVSSATSRNFVIDFGDDEAWCAFDLEADAIEKLVKTAVSLRSATAWTSVLVDIVLILLIACKEAAKFEHQMDVSRTRFIREIQWLSLTSNIWLPYNQVPTLKVSTGA
jgi:hypothetical protein